MFTFYDGSVCYLFAVAAAARRAFRVTVNDMGMIELPKIVDNSPMIHRAPMGGSRTGIIAHGFV